MVAVVPDIPSSPDDAWAAVSALKPRLKTHVRVYHHMYRGQAWYVVRDPAAAQYFRFPDSTYSFIGALDGSRTLAAVHAGLEATRDDAPDREEITRLIASLRAANLLDMKLRPSTAALLDRAARKRRARWVGTLARPFSVRVPVFDPDALLERLSPWTNWLFGRVGVVLWLACVTVGLLIALTEWGALREHAVSRLPDPANLALLYAIYPSIKTVHELAHGLAVKRWRGAVHEMGIMLLVLVPVPYVDASAASAFPRRRARITVGAAGVAAESTLAGLGLLAWYLLEPGLVRDVAFHVALIGGVSTLLINGNPLLRFDGYYVLADLISIPGLGRRSTTYYGYLCQRYLLGLRDAESPVMASGERGWFLIYAPAAFIYRMLVMLSIVILALDLVPVVGAALAAWALFSILGLPLLKLGRYLLTHPDLHRRRLRAIGVTLLIALCSASATLIRVPTHTNAQGLVTAPATSAVRAEADGFVHSVLREQGDWVGPGEVLFRLENRQLESRVAELAARVDELDARRLRDSQTSVAKGAISATDVSRARAELRDALARSSHLAIKSHVQGRLNLAAPRDIHGRFVRKGELVAHVVDGTASTVQVVVPESELDLVRNHTREVQVRLEHATEEHLTGRVIAAEPAATTALPSALLGTAGGGDVSVDARDQSGVQVLAPVFLVEIELSRPRPDPFVGGRAYVRFEHEAFALSEQILRAARQQLLRHLPD